MKQAISTFIVIAIIAATVWVLLVQPALAELRALAGALGGPSD